ncbi:MAG: ParB/RepB/Spo0J family partition protein [Polyangiales bacterium]
MRSSTYDKGAAGATVIRIALSEIVLDERCQARAEPSEESVADYAKQYVEDETQMPPIEVVRVGDEYVVTDGHHRTKAAIAAGCAFISAVVVGKGDLDFAVWTAAASNKRQNALRRTNADKRHAIRMALNGIGQVQSSRAIAEHVGVDHKTVAKIREEWEQSRLGNFPTCPDESESPSPQPTRRLGKDGKRYPASKPANDNAQTAVRIYAPVTATPMPDYGEAVRKVATLIGDTKRQAKKNWPDEEEAAWTQIATALDRARVVAAGVVPVICGDCHGSGVGCKWCGQQGWLYESQQRSNAYDRRGRK